MFKLSKRELDLIIALFTVLVIFIALKDTIPKSIELISLRKEIVDLKAEYDQKEKVCLINRVEGKNEINTIEQISEKLIIKDVKKELMLKLDELEGEVNYLSFKETTNGYYDFHLRYLGGEEDFEKLLNLFKNLSIKAEQEKLVIIFSESKNDKLSLDYNARINKEGYLIKMNDGDESIHEDWAKVFKKQ